MKKICNAKITVSVMNTADQAFSCSSPKEEICEIPETTSHCTESSYDTIPTPMADDPSSAIKEASLLSSSDTEASNEEKDDKVGSLGEKMSRRYPTISCSSQHSVVSDITDTDCFSFVDNNNGSDKLQNEIDALKFIISKSKYFSSKQISKRLKQLEAITETQRTEEDGIARNITKKAKALPREEDITEITKTSRRKPRKPRTRRPRTAKSNGDTSMSESLLHPSQDDSATHLLSMRSLPTVLLEDKTADRHDQSNNATRKERTVKTKRQRSRESRSTSVSSNTSKSKSSMHSTHDDSSSRTKPSSIRSLPTSLLEEDKTDGPLCQSNSAREERSLKKKKKVSRESRSKSFSSNGSKPKSPMHSTHCDDSSGRTRPSSIRSLRSLPTSLLEEEEETNEQHCQGNSAREERSLKKKKQRSRESRSTSVSSNASKSKSPMHSTQDDSSGRTKPSSIRSLRSLPTKLLEQDNTDEQNCQSNSAREERTLKIKRQRYRKSCPTSVSISNALTPASPMHSSHEDNSGRTLPSSIRSLRSLPTKLLEEEEEDNIDEQLYQSNSARSERTVKTKRHRIRNKPRPTSVSHNLAGEIIEEFNYQPHHRSNNSSAKKNDSLSERTGVLDSSKNKKKRGKKTKENLWGTMVKRGGNASSPPSAKKK